MRPLESDQIIQKMILEAWELRDSHQLEKCQDLVRDIRFQLQKSDFNYENSLQLDLLDVAIWRGQKQIQKSNQALREIEVVCSDQRLPLPFQFYYQKALNFYSQSEMASSLEFFLMAQQRAQGQKQVLLCLINSLLCLENLGLPYQKVLSEIEQILTLTEDGAQALRVRKILKTFYQRQAFRSGEVAKIFAATSIHREMQQLEYYKSWVHELPFIRFQWAEKDSTLEELSLSSSLYLKKYRLKTLMSEMGSWDEDEAPIQEQADRIYLWTWRWLMDPSDHNRAHLRKAWLAFNCEAALRQMSCEDVQLVRNALGWICLFQPKVKLRYQAFISLIHSRQIPTFTVYEHEKKWIDLLQAQLQQKGEGLKPLRQQLAKDPLSTVAELGFSHAYERLLSMQGLKRRKTGGIQVNPYDGQIEFGQGLLISKPIALLLQSLREAGSLTFAEALDIAFQIQPYEEGVHQAKIHNLLSRAKKILPEGLSLKTREQTIFLMGDRGLIHIKTASGHDIPIFQDADFSSGGEGGVGSGSSMPLQASLKLRQECLDRWVHPRLILKKALGKKNLSRQELQALTKASKATANRWISKWLEQGMISRVGTGRATLYNIEIT